MTPQYFVEWWDGPIWFLLILQRVLEMGQKITLGAVHVLGGFASADQGRETFHNWAESDPLSPVRQMPGCPRKNAWEMGLWEKP